MVVHDHPPFTQIQKYFTPLASSLVGEDVEPSYNFLALYMHMGICKPHLDAPSAKWTLDICFDQSNLWPIQFGQIVPWPESPPSLDGDWRSAIKNSRMLAFQAKTLEPGDAIIFSGSSRWHYRDALLPTKQAAFCDLYFLHYIPKGASEFVSPRNSVRHFGIP